MEKKEERVEVRMSRTEKAMCEQRAREANLTVSEWIRKKILADLARKAMPVQS